MRWHGILYQQMAKLHFGLKVPKLCQIFYYGGTIVKRYGEQAMGWTILGLNSVRGNRLFLLESVQTSCRVHLVKLTTHLHLVPSLGMSGVIPLLPLSAFMVWTWTTLSP